MIDKQRLSAAAYWACLVLGALGFGFFSVLALLNFLDGNSHDATNRAINAVTIAAFAWVIGGALNSGQGLIETAIKFWNLYIFILIGGGLLAGVAWGLMLAFMV